MAFDDEIKKLESRLERTELNILVWGPGKGAFEHFQKREKIRETLRKRFPYADVRFSEEIEGPKDLSIPEQESWHIATCQLCVVLDTSKGAGEEIAHFIDRWAHRLLILTHERYKPSCSFPASLREKGNQLFYCDDEYNSCSLVERIVVRIRQVALNRMAELR